MPIKTLLICLLLASNHSLATADIRLWDRGLPIYNEYVEILVKNSEDKYGPITITLRKRLGQGPALVALKTGKDINLAVTSLGRAYEQQYLPIYYPINKGFQGFRVCLVQETKRDLFAKVKNIKDMREKKLTIGVGTHWGDTAILRLSNAPIVTTPRYDPMYEMLADDRFDCFFRSVTEIQKNIKDHADQKIAIEPHLGFMYAEGHILYVSKSEPELHERLQYGLHKALKNGDLDRLFDKYLGSTLEDLNFFSRNLILLSNPYLTENGRKTLSKYGFVSFEHNKNFVKTPEEEWQ